MGKTLKRSIIWAAAATLCLFIFQWVYALIFGSLPLVSIPVYGGEVISSIGIGLILDTFYPLSDGTDVSAIPSNLSIHIPSLIASFAVLLLVFLILFSLMKKKER